MGRKIKAQEEEQAPRGRPPLPPKTQCARWLRENGYTVQSLAAAMIEVAPKLKLPKRAAPQPKTLLDAVNGRHWPSLPTVLMIREISKGAIDVQHWVADLYE